MTVTAGAKIKSFMPELSCPSTPSIMSLWQESSLVACSPFCPSPLSSLLLILWLWLWLVQDLDVGQTINATAALMIYVRHQGGDWFSNTRRVSGKWFTTLCELCILESSKSFGLMVNQKSSGKGRQKLIIRCGTMNLHNLLFRRKRILSGTLRGPGCVGTLSNLPIKQ